MNNKKGAIGEGIVMIYRLALITFVALVIIGMSAIYYNYHIEIKDVEAQILAKDIFNCIAGNGIFNADLNYNPKILDYCNIKNIERFYVKASVTQNTNELKVFEQGDSGLPSVKKLFEVSPSSSTTQIKKYEPGLMSIRYPILILKNNQQTRGELNLYILVGEPK